ncbi:MAG: translocation protein TolB [Deltaproteobacteria bacterium]|nr:translocation protein TolB [Deltaproteobacteria bacterium]
MTLHRIPFPICFAAALATLCLALPRHALAQDKGEELPQITITDPNRNLLKLGIPNAGGEGALATEASGIARRNFVLVGLFQVLNPVSFPPALQVEGLGFSSALWSQVGAQAVIKLEVVAGDQKTLKGRLYQTGRGDKATFAKDYRGADLRMLVHAFTNDVIKELTGVMGVFGSRIVFARPKRELMSVGMDGEHPAVHTNMRSDCLLPAYSPTGDRIAFTSYLSRTPDLWVVPSRGGRASRVSKREGMNTGAVFTPDGGSIVLTLSFEGNAELYRIDARDGKVQKRLTDHPGIDSSPSLSPDGSQVAFVSNRQGTPQVFVMPTSGGAAKRITFRGNYNQTPRWNPRKDKQQIAFTGRDEKGSFDVFVADLQKNEILRMTQNRKSNFDPAWSPDGRLLVYASSRGGLFVLNPETLNEEHVWKGNARSPYWGPAPTLGQ